MVKIMENPIKLDDLGGTIIFGHTHMFAHPMSILPENEVVFLGSQNLLIQ